MKYIILFHVCMFLFLGFVFSGWQCLFLLLGMLILAVWIFSLLLRNCFLLISSLNALLYLTLDVSQMFEILGFLLIFFIFLMKAHTYLR